MLAKRGNAVYSGVCGSTLYVLSFHIIPIVNVTDLNVMPRRIMSSFQINTE